MEKYYVLKKQITSRAEFCKLVGIDITKIANLTKADWYDLDLINGRTYSNSIYTVTFKK